MHGHRTAKRVLRMSFTLIQLILFPLGIALTILSISLYIKLRNVFGIPFKLIMTLVFHHLLLIKIAVLGLNVINDYNRHLNLLYITLTLFAINIQLLGSVAYAMKEDAVKWAAGRFEIMNDRQRIYLTDSLKCCGFKGCEPLCGFVVEKLHAAIKGLLFKFAVGMIFFESLSIIILLILKMKSKKVKK